MFIQVLIWRCCYVKKKFFQPLALNRCVRLSLAFSIILTFSFLSLSSLRLFSLPFYKVVCRTIPTLSSSLSFVHIISPSYPFSSSMYNLLAFKPGTQSSPSTLCNVLSLIFHTLACS